MFHPGYERHHGNLHSNLTAPTIHRFLNARNTTALQANCSLTYAGNNIYVPTSFCQTLSQGDILAIPDPYAPTGLSPLLTPPSSASPANAQQRAMQIEVLLSMGHDRLSKEEVIKLLDQRVHVFMSTQEMRHLTRNFVKLVGDYLVEGSPVCVSMASWPRRTSASSWRRMVGRFASGTPRRENATGPAHALMRLYTDTRGSW